MGFLVGVDIGGTFTDCAVVGDAGGVTVGKAPTTPAEPAEGFFSSIRVAAELLGLTDREMLGNTDRLAHGTTTGTNAVVTRSGARVGLLATKGHADSIRIMDNTGRATGVPLEELLHPPSSSLPAPFVERGLTREVTERIDYAGDIVVGLHEGELVQAAADLVQAGAEALAVCFLWSFMNSEHELRAAELVSAAHPGVHVSLSHAVAPKVGEYPRMATTILNAYLGPIMGAYTREIESRAAELGYRHDVLVMHCNGGLARGERVRETPILTLQSGPVAGVIATGEFGRAVGAPDVITTDMGGTTFDVSVIETGRPLVRDETVIEQHRLFLNMVDVQSLGAGGGSIAWVDEVTGTLHVGPQSAAADPGPACYGRGGTEPTVTDADLVLGVLDPDRFLGGRLTLDRAAAEAAIRPIAEALGLTVDECAAGIVRVVDSRMSDLIRSMTVQRGLDPRNFTLYAYGGGAGAHAGLYTDGLGIRRFVVPLRDAASIWSAVGLATADLLDIHEQPLFMHDPFDPGTLTAAFDALERQAQGGPGETGVSAKDVRLERYARCKYGLQVYEVQAPAPDGPLDEAGARAVADAFEEVYARRYGEGAGYRQAGIILTAIGVRVHGPVRKPAAAGASLAAETPEAAAQVGERDVYWAELRARTPTPVWNGEQLAPGNVVGGPAVVELPDTTVVVRPHATLEIDAFGSAVVTAAAGAGVTDPTGARG